MVNEASRRSPYIPIRDNDDVEEPPVFDTNSSTQHDPSLDQPPSSLDVAAFFLLGIGTVLPWNALLSSIDFYSTLFPDISIAQYITNAYTFPFMVAGIYLALSPSASNNYHAAISIGFILLTLLSAALPVIVSRHHPFETALAASSSLELWATVFISAVIGAVSSMLQSTIFGMVALCRGGACTTAFSTGGGFSSIFIVVLRIIFRLLLDEGSQSLASLQPAFKVFFLSCSVLCCSCVVVFLLLHHCSTYYFVYVKASRLPAQPFEEVLQSARSTLKDISFAAVQLLLSFTATLTVFPAILVKVPMKLRDSISPTWNSWYPLMIVFVFAIGDTIGRSCITENEVLNWEKRLLRNVTVLRILMVPALILMWTGISPVGALDPFWLTLVLGLGNGITVTWTFLSAPLLTSRTRCEMAGRLMFVMLISGMSMGSILSWIIELGLRCVKKDF